MSGQNYIGSKISLISLSDIRYVGILQNINPIESTVALQNVKSYGTEGRKGNLNEEIPASDNEFDYVVFRGSDIKDLQVFEAPPSFQSEYSNRTLQQQHEQQQQCDTMTNIATYPLSYYTAQQAYSTVSYHHAPYSNAMNQNNGYWQSTSGPTPGSVFSNQVHQQQQFSYQQRHQQLQKPRFQMPVPENYQVLPLSNGPSIVEPASFSSANQTLLGNYDSLNKASPKKQEEDQDKTVAPVFSEKEAVVTAAPTVSKTVMQTSTSQEKEEVAVIGEIDDVLVDSLAKQVSDLDIKQPAPVIKEVSKASISSNNKEKLGVRKQQDSSRQRTIKEGSSSGGRKSGGRQHSAPRVSTADSNSNKNGSKNVSQTEAISSHEGSGRRNNTNINRGINSQGCDNARGTSTINHPHNSGIIIPKADFDFASSNAKFDKNVITKDESFGEENEAVIIPETNHFYDKKKSFFDDISCESKEYKKRSNRTGTYKEEIKLNLETFGQTNTADQNGKRHRYRSGRGRGRPQQRGSRNKPIINQATQDTN